MFSVQSSYKIKHGSGVCFWDIIIDRTDGRTDLNNDVLKMAVEKVHTTTSTGISIQQFMKVYNWLICNTYKHICKMKIIAPHLPVVHFPFFPLLCVHICACVWRGAGGGVRGSIFY